MDAVTQTPGPALEKDLVFSQMGEIMKTDDFKQSPQLMEAMIYQLRHQLSSMQGQLRQSLSERKRLTRDLSNTRKAQHDLGLARALKNLNLLLGRFDKGVRQAVFQAWKTVTQMTLVLSQTQQSSQDQNHRQGIKSLEALGKRMQISACQYAFGVWVEYKIFAMGTVFNGMDHLREVQDLSNPVKSAVLSSML